MAMQKLDSDSSLLKSYRPISLLSCVSKVLERIVTDRVTFHLENRAQISDYQFGFRSTRSTEWALWNFVQAAGVTMKSRRKTIMVSLDIDSAYDRVWHEGLLVKLSSVGIPLGLLGWIGTFLQATLRVGLALCTRHLLMGVPQGSPLSPILFLIFIDDIIQTLRSLAQAQAFANDMVIWWTVAKGEMGNHLGNSVLDAVTAWANKWKMIFNPDKCKFLVISRLRREPTPVLRLGGVALECVPCLRYLGVMIDSTLSWSDHIAWVSQRALT